MLLKGWDVACGELGSWRLGQDALLPGGFVRVTHCRGRSCVKNEAMLTAAGKGGEASGAAFPCKLVFLCQTSPVSQCSCP